LQDDITISEAITLASGQHVKLVPEGKNITVKRGSGFTVGFLFTVSSGASLTLAGNADGKELIIDGGAVWGNDGDPTKYTTKTDLQNGNTGVKAYGSTYGYGLINVSGGTLTMEEGVILQNNDTGAKSGGDGGAVRGNNGVFYMKGGTIQFNVAVGGGGVALRSNDTMIFSGGVVRSNVGHYGGGIDVYLGGLYMSGNAQITGNRTMVVNTSGGWGGTDGGGGVHVGGAFSMSGGTIAGNYAHVKGGGISVNGGTFTKTGGTVYGSGGTNENTAPSGAALYKNTNGTVTINDTSFDGTTKDDTF
jgi:hypothetical protein